MRFRTPASLLAGMAAWFLVAALVCPAPAAGPTGPIGNDSGAEQAAASPELAYDDLVSADRPVAWWSFAETGGVSVANRAETGAALDGTIVGGVQLGQPGPPAAVGAAFAEGNVAAAFNGCHSSVRVSDPGADSPLDFTKGDSITLEAWVKPARIRDGQHVYVVGKGRTNNAGFPKENQNYALRLTGKGGAARLSFLFRNVANRPGNGRDFHRWTADAGFAPDGRWHHVAVSYTFGGKDSLTGYVDGQPVAGTWDMGGSIDHAPVVDDDELWIGSSLSGGSNTFHGSLDEVAVYRQVLPPERIRLRAQPAPRLDLAEIDAPSDAVLVEIIEGIPDGKTWDFVPPPAVESYRESAFAFTDVPRKYSERGVQIDRANPLLLRAASRIELPAGWYELLVRCRSAARLYVDGELLAQTPFHDIPNNGHGTIRDWSKVKRPGLRRLAMGDHEDLATFDSRGGPHVFVLEVFVGGGKRRPELGETSVSWCAAESRIEGRKPRAGVEPLPYPDDGDAEARGPFVLLGPGVDVPLTDAGWRKFVRERSDALARLNAENRRRISVAETAYWNWRHDLAREMLADEPAPAPSDVPNSMPVQNNIDRFIGRRLADAGQPPAALTGDAAFVRRVALDVIGTVPTVEQIEAFLADERPDRRSRFIDQLLDRPGWADHWVAYWQDALAENPNIVNPTLNNTGPFRWWIHESFTDNKPVDRFVTELVMMEGSTYYGGPAGFALATQNDSPMAAKAHILGEAFLAVELQCARCHDAPFHDVKQRDLFALAGMLNRGSLGVPPTSTIPLEGDALESLIVEVTLRPGEEVSPEWPFSGISTGEIPHGVLRRSDDSRERLAALITLPGNERFARVFVNRMWKRYLGRGLVEPVHDWEQAAASHPDLLDWLARELITSGYDQKHVARLILNSHAYQRVATAAMPVDDPYLFAAPLRRRLTAEQLVDSLFLAAGKDFNCGPMSADIDGARNYDQSLNLGVPRRAWQFTSLSNERDRPSLALPFAQPFVDVLEAYRWRSSRQNPINVREAEPNVIQPAVLLNGVLASRITRLSDDGAFTELALSGGSLDALIERVFLRLLSRPPTDEERGAFAELLAPGFEDRVIDDPDYVPREPLRYRDGVSWSNHLSPEANEIKVEMERLVQAGDPPTGRLREDWRRRMEDMIWTLMNSPEFVWVP